MSTKTKTKTAKPHAAATKSETAPKSALDFKGYTAEARAVVSEVRKYAVQAASAGVALASALADAFRMELHMKTGHRDLNSWAMDALMSAAPNIGRSSAYAWIEAAHALVGIERAGLDAAQFPTDTLRIIGSRTNTGQDPQRMADLAKSLASDESLRNKSGRVDPAKAKRMMKGAPVAEDRGVKVAEYARKIGGGTKEGALQMLHAALIVAQAWTK
jgi:hypothetical protein